MATATVRRKLVRDETFKLFKQEGLEGWRVRFNPRMTRALGRCIPSQKTIEYQPRFMAQNAWDEVVLTVRHEVAHALNPRSGHGYDWKRDCLRLGGTGLTTNSTATIIYKFKGTCHKCGTTVERDKRRQSACGKCCREFNGGRFSSEYLLTWTRNN